MRASRPVTRSGGSVLKAPVPIVVGAPQRGAFPAAEAVARSGGFVLKAPQRRRGGIPPRSVNAKLRKHPYPRFLMRRREGTPPRSVNAKLHKPPNPHILRHEKPRVFSPGGEEDTGLYV